MGGSAIRTLSLMGYSWEGGELWKPPLKIPSDKYYVINKSQSGHCCFEYSVMESSADVDSSFNNAYCECFDRKSADAIVRALNSMEKT